MHLFFDIFGVKVPAYGLCIALGLCFVMLFLYKQRIYKELDFDTALSAMIYAILAGGICAKILYWITDPESFMILFNNSISLIERLKISFQGGLVFLGGLIGAIIGIYLFLKEYNQLDPLKTIDIFAISMPILQMFGRIGCFFAGCCYGKVCINSSIGVVFPDSGLAPSGIPLIPTQLFGALGNLFLVIILLTYNRKPRRKGNTMGIYLTLYSIGRFILEFFRGDEIRGLYFGVSTSQWISIPILFLGLFLLFRKGEKNEEDTFNI